MTVALQTLRVDHHASSGLWTVSRVHTAKPSCEELRTYAVPTAEFHTEAEAQEFVVLEEEREKSK